MENKKVLIVDDKIHILSLMKRLIRKLGCRVDTASSGKEAIALFRQAVTSGTPYSLVVMDREMPEMNGEIVLMEFREIWPGVVALLHSGDITSEVYNNYDEFGFAGVLDKPSTAEVVVSVVSAYLN